MPRFVLLRHECPPDYEKPSHWDLMLEQGESLATWELQELPTSWAQQMGQSMAIPKESVPVIRLPDHRIAYLEYEGPLSKGRGDVLRCDGGAFQLLSQQENAIEVLLAGRVLQGVAKISREATGWQLTLES